jgi:hypothetical protein
MVTPRHEASPFDLYQHLAFEALEVYPTAAQKASAIWPMRFP